MRDDDCVFCQIVAGEAPATMIERGRWHVAFVPIGPYAPGHVLFVPKEHVKDATDRPIHTAAALKAAANYVRDWNLQANLITSIGPDATQSVFHAHVHVIPRGEKDGLRDYWPWRGGHKR